MFAEYKLTTDRMVKAFGAKTAVASLRPADFAKLGHELATAFGPVRRGNEVQKARTVFKWGFDSELIDALPRYGPEFRKPDRSELRKHRASQGPRRFSAEEIRRLIDAAGPQLRAMTYLGINCAFGNSDCGTLPLTALDLDAGWVNYPRPKTGIDRKARLWPETAAALRAALAVRPEPKDPAAEGLVFVTRFGGPWASEGQNGVGQRFGKLLKKLGINGRVGLGFYSLRHSFRTVADGTKDTNAIRTVMGHCDGSIDASYIEGLPEDSRLEAVAAFVRAWLFGAPTSPPIPGKEGGDR
jgi:integrase